jgi:hypothetical protein
MSIEFSRRALLRGAAATCMTAFMAELVSCSSSPHTTRIDGMVRPLSAQAVHNGYGVCASPTFRTSVYEDVDAWMADLAKMEVRYFRGLYHPGNDGCQAALAAARKHNIGWLMLVVPESSSGPTHQGVAETAAIVKAIAAHAPDVCYGIEGLNEPNQNRSSSVPVPSTWALTATAHQKAIWTTAKADARLATKPIVGPSLHAVAAMQSYTESYPSGGRHHYEQLKNAGIAAFQNWQGLHSYPGGEPPTYHLEEQLREVYIAFGSDYRVWITETGYTTALSGSGGQASVSQATAATYGAQAVLAFAKRGLRVTRFELLDDVDPGAEDVQGPDFGLWRVGSTDPQTWVAKPEVAKVTALLHGLDDPGPKYLPASVRLKVNASVPDLDVTVVGKRDGSVRAYLYRRSPVWDTGSRRAITVPTTLVTVTDRLGPRTIRVGPDVVAMRLR